MTAPFDVLRVGYAELIVTDLAASKAFYEGVLGLYVTYEDDSSIHLRGFEEYLYHSLVLKKGPEAALGALAYRVRSNKEVKLATEYFKNLGCRIEVRKSGATRGIGEAVRVEDPLGFPIEFFYEADHVERFTQRYDLHGAGAITRLDHFNIMTPDVPLAQKYYEGLGFRVSEDIRDKEGTVFASWLFRKPTVHDIALTGGDGPRMHHIAFNTHEQHHILYICDRLGAFRQSDRIERGPGRHGVSNAFYLYLRDPDGHRIEIYTQDYYTGDPDNPLISWDVHDNQRRDWWGNPVVPSWYNEGSKVLDLDGKPKSLVARTETAESTVTIGADGFSYTREGDPMPEYKLGHQV